MGKGRKSVCECTYGRFTSAKERQREERERKTRQEDRGDFLGPTL